MEFADIEWQPLSRTGFVAWLLFYLVVLLFLAAHFGQLTLLDNLHLVTHEAGHLLFGWLGETPELWGGTLLQLLVPALLAIAFVVRREIPGVVFCMFAFFHSLSGVAIYMSDALRRELPLVTVGAPADEADHDWVRIFSQMGVLPHAIQIGNITRLIAWMGMLAAVAWMCWRYWQQERIYHEDTAWRATTKKPFLPQSDVAATKGNTFETQRNRVSGGNKNQNLTTETRRH